MGVRNLLVRCARNQGSIQRYALQAILGIEGDGACGDVAAIPCVTADNRQARLKNARVFQEQFHRRVTNVDRQIGR